MFFCQIKEDILVYKMCKFVSVGLEIMVVVIKGLLYEI